MRNSDDNGNELLASSNKDLEESHEDREYRMRKFQGEVIKLSFRNLNYSVTLKSTSEEIEGGSHATRKLDILKNCSGFCLPG